LGVLAPLFRGLETLLLPLVERLALGIGCRVAVSDDSVLISAASTIWPSPTTAWACRSSRNWLWSSVTPVALGCLVGWTTTVVLA